MPFLRPVAIVGSLVLMLTASLSAQEADRRKAQENAAGTRLLDSFFRVPAGVKLDDEKMTKRKALREKRRTEVFQKVRDIQQEINSVYTEEQKQTRNKVVREGLEAKKKRREIQQAVAAAVKLTKE